MKSGLLFLFVIIKINIIVAQMQKIVFPDTTCTYIHCTQIDGNIISVDCEYRYYNPTDKRDDYVVILNKRNKFWVKTQRIDNLDYCHGTTNRIFAWGRINKNRLLTAALVDNRDEILKILRYKNGIFQEYDTIIPDTNYTPYNDVSIINEVIKDDWIFFDTYFNVSLTSSDYQYDNYFFHYENGEWVKKSKISKINSFNTWTSARYGMSNNYLVSSNTYQVTIYKRSGMIWNLYQTIEPPDSINISRFAYNLSFSPDEKWIALSGRYKTNNYKFKGIIFLYHFEFGKWKLKQMIKQPENNKNKYTWGLFLNINNNELLFGTIDERKGRGAIQYYVLNHGVWKKKSEIFPPMQDTIYASFGRGIDRYEETVVTGAPNVNNDCSDYYNYGYSPSVYIFQIPARDTLNATICEGESYTFNDTVIYDSGHYTDTLLASYGVDSVVQLYLTVYPKDRIEIDTVLCDDQQLIIGDSVLTEEGIYTITLQNQYGCDSIVIAKIEYDYHPEVTDSITADYGCKNGEIKLSVEGNNPPYAFDWSGGQTGEYLSGLSYGNYNVTITSHSGCEYDYEYEVGDSIAYLIPNAFFPSGQEEINKEFRPYLAKDVHIISTEIFDRWGEKVFYGGEDEIWDGTYKGMMQSPGVYLYKILIDSPCGEEVKTGQVVLLR